MKNNNYFVLLIALICSLISVSAIAQDSELSNEIQNAIKIRKDNELKIARGDNQTNFLIGMCLNIQGNSGCDLNKATKNINGKITSSEAWISFLEAKGIFENYVMGLNGQISDTEGLVKIDLRYRVIDNNNVERETISGKNCVHTLQFRKINSNSVISKTTRVSDGCSEQFKTMMRDDTEWSKPKNIYPLENRFPITSNTQANTQSQKNDPVMSDRLIKDLFNYRWVNNLPQCNAVNTNYTQYDKNFGRYFVMSGKKQIDPKSTPFVEINEISANRVNMFIGIGERAKSENLFNMIVKLEITRQSDGSTLVRETTANYFDNNGRLLTRDASLTRKPTDTKYFPCSNESTDASSSPLQNQQSSKPTQTLNYPHGKYVGEVLNGKAHGYGSYTSAKSGTVYSGQFIADTFNGEGTMTWTNGSRYVGKWQNDTGVSGVMTYSNGATASGIVKNGNFIRN